MPRKYKKSHNSYWSRPQVVAEVEAGCNILEIDLVFLRGKAVAMHSRKPLELFGFGTLHEYIEKIIELVPYDCVLQVEIKDGRGQLDNEIADTIKHFQSKMKHIITYAVFADPSRADRVKVAKGVLRKLASLVNVVSWDEWSQGKDIEVVDLFGEIKWWWK